MYAALPSWKPGTCSQPLQARASREPAAANCSNKRATWRLWRPRTCTLLARHQRRSVRAAPPLSKQGVRVNVAPPISPCQKRVVASPG
jgi:hypothetical protein